MSCMSHLSCVNLRQSQVNKFRGCPSSNRVEPAILQSAKTGEGRNFVFKGETANSDPGNFCL
jgi:hypothetical protein